MDVKQFREYIVRPSLVIVGMHSLAAENLLIGTALVESRLYYLKQIQGPALGVYQMEEATFADLCRYLNRNQKIKDKFLAAIMMDMMPSSQSLIYNLRLATLMARLKYWMVSESLPVYNDAQGLADYHKKYYNGPGKTDVSKSVRLFERAIKGGDVS